MHCTEHYTIRTRLHTLAAAALSVAGLLLLPAANAQMNRAQSPSPAISNAKLNAAAAAIRQVSSIQQSYQRKIEAAPSDKQRLTIEANDAMAKAVTDQGLSVDEYNSIISTAQNDPAVREKLSQRMRRSGH
jgi:hypothetical protein